MDGTRLHRYRHWHLDWRRWGAYLIKNAGTGIMNYKAFLVFIEFYVIHKLKYLKTKEERLREPVEK